MRFTLQQQIVFYLAFSLVKIGILNNLLHYIDQKMLGAHFLQVLVLLHLPGNVTCSRCTWIDCEQYRLIS